MSEFEQKFWLKVPSSTANLALIRDFVTSIGRMATLGDAQVAEIELAVDEACANVIEHAYGHDMTKEVTIRATYDNDELCIDVIDTGQGFDPARVPQLELERLAAERQGGGLGLRLIRTLMDEVNYEMVPGKKNALHMKKHIKATSFQDEKGSTGTHHRPDDH